MTTTEFIQFLLERFQIEWTRRDRSGIYGLTQRLLAYNSNKIEGSTLTEEQTASLFDTGTLPKSDDYYRAKDVEEMNGHFLMFNKMLETIDQPLSQELIKQFHYELKSGVFEDRATRNVRTLSVCMRQFFQAKFRKKWENCSPGIPPRMSLLKFWLNFMFAMKAFILSRMETDALVE